MKETEIEMYWIVLEYIFNTLETNLKVWERERERDKERVMSAVYTRRWLFLTMALRALVIV